MNKVKTYMEEVLLFENKVHGDNRGFFMESYNDKKASQEGLDFKPIQDNHSLTRKGGTIRGFHYQLEPKAQGKLVRVLRGAVWDVVVDVRKGSPTFGEWAATILSEGNKRQLFVPKGFAHGFCTIVDDTEVLYKVDEHYAPEHERGIIWNDPKIAVDWPCADPRLSEKDKLWPPLEDIDTNFIYKRGDD